MADKSQTEQHEGREATVGISGDVKSLQQLSSSAKAALEKRNQIKNAKAKRMLDEAAEKAVRDDQPNPSKDSH